MYTGIGCYSLATYSCLKKKRTIHRTHVDQLVDDTLYDVNEIKKAMEDNYGWR